MVLALVRAADEPPRMIVSDRALARFSRSLMSRNLGSKVAM
jgi:hypothetical protein